MYSMCASNYSAENTPHSLGSVLDCGAVDLWSVQKEGDGEKAKVCWTWGPDSSFPSRASAVLGEIREDRGLRWVWI